MFSLHKGGGFGNVQRCCNSVENNRIIPSAHPHASTFPNAHNEKPLLPLIPTHLLKEFIVALISTRKLSNVKKYIFVVSPLAPAFSTIWAAINVLSFNFDKSITDFDIPDFLLLILPLLSESISSLNEYILINLSPLNTMKLSFISNPIILRL